MLKKFLWSILSLMILVSTPVVVMADTADESALGEKIPLSGLKIRHLQNCVNKKRHQGFEAAVFLCF